jgi:cytochrome c556
MTAALSGTLALSLLAGTTAMATDAPFADQVEMRHGLMLVMAESLGKLGAIAKGDAAYDPAVATKAAQDVAAIASVLSMDQFPQGSEYGAAADSFAKAELWANPSDFLQKIADLNTAAGAMVTAAGTSGEAIKGAMAQLGGACSACHQAYRQPEN